MDDSKKSREKVPEVRDEIPIDPKDIAAAAAAAEEADAAALAAADAAMAKEFGSPEGQEQPAPDPPVPAETDPQTAAAEGNEPEAEPASPDKPPQEPQKPVPAPRDYNAEFAELLQVYPELKGKGVPDELVEQFKTSPRDVLSVYEHFMVGELTKKVSDLETELARVRQNAETAARAPVVGSVGSSSAESGDSFLNCFNRYFGGN
ncbi:MAG: hypothetical protein Q4F31_09345 [Eubacteriales bacterium]|nr:hypothetical protein [Eubacteriales bacterium]